MRGVLDSAQERNQERNQGRKEAADCPNPESQTTARRGAGALREGAVRLLAAAALLVVAALPAAAGWRDGTPPEARLDYAITRDGAAVGRQTVEFLRTNTGFVVRTQVDIVVEFLLLTLYRFEHDSVETWADGRLVALVSRTNDDGKKRMVELQAEDDKLVGTYNGSPRDLPGDIIPASLWHPGTLSATILLDPVRGRARDVAVQDLGNDRIGAEGREIEARHYAITGQIERELWYDSDGKLVKVQFAAKDGSEIAVTLQ